MNFNDIFNSETITEIKNTLDLKCINGKRLTRSQLCQALALTSPLEEGASKEDRAKNNTIEAVVGAIISMRVIPGYNSRQGKEGGIGKEEVSTAPKDKKVKKGAASAKKSISFPEGFIDNLTETMTRLCKDGIAQRKAIISEMTLPKGIDEDKAATLISAAMSQGKLSGFGSKPGSKGGFYALETSV